MGEEHRRARTRFAPECPEGDREPEQADEHRQPEDLGHLRGRLLAADEPRASVTAAPTSATGSAGEPSSDDERRRGDDGQTQAELGRARDAGSRSPIGALRWLDVRQRPPTPAVTARAARAGAHMRARKPAPLRCRWPSTIRLVRFEPGRNSDPALDKSKAAVKQGAPRPHRGLRPCRRGRA